MAAVALALAASGVAAMPADGAYYRGGGHRIRVEFRIEHDRIVYGRIATTQFCIEPRGKKPDRHYRRRVRAYFGNYVHRYPPDDSTDIFNWEVRVRHGRIDERSAGSNTSVSSYSAYSLVAGVRPARITGGFIFTGTGLFTYPRDRGSCRTDRFWRAGSHSRRTRPLRFVARRMREPANTHDWR